MYLGGNISASAVPLLLLPILTRSLEPSEYGQTVSFTILIAFWQTIIGLNTQAAIGVYWFREPQAIGEYGSAILLVIGATGLMGIIASPVLIKGVMRASISNTFAALAVVVAMMNAIVQCRVSLWQAKQKVKSVVALQIGSALINISTSLALVTAFHLGASGRNLGVLVSSMLMAVISVVTMVRNLEMKCSFDIVKIKTLVVYGFPLVFHSLAAFILGTNDRWMVAAILTPEELGIYGATAQIGSAMFLFADAFVKAYTPWVYDRLKGNTVQDKFRVVGSIYIAIPSFILVALCGLGATLLAAKMFLGNRFQGGGHLLPAILFGGVMNASYMCFAPLYFYSGKTKLLASITVISAGVGSVVSYFLTWRFGMIGAASGSAITWSLLAIGNLSVAVRTFDLPWKSTRQSLQEWYTFRVPTETTSGSSGVK
jgi:O-antigen/teichoic acid export membrane protein